MERKGIKGERISDETFTKCMAISFVGLFVCIVALCGSTLAWYNASSSSGGNVIVSGRYALEVTITDAEGEEIQVFDNRNGTVTCDLVSAGRYTVNLTISDDSTATKGYCEVVVGTAVGKPTCTISHDSEIGTAPFVFDIVTADEHTRLLLVTKWGFPSHPEIVHGATIYADLIDDDG